MVARCPGVTCVSTAQPNDPGTMCRGCSPSPGTVGRDTPKRLTGEHALLYGARGARVEKLISALNQVNPTRLPRLSGRSFDELTMARLMEFRFYMGLTTDGVAGPTTLSRIQRLSARSSREALPFGRAIVVNLIREVGLIRKPRQELAAHEDEKINFIMAQIPCHGGSVDHPTSRGVFQMRSERYVHHTMCKISRPPGQHAILAFLHQGRDNMLVRLTLHRRGVFTFGRTRRRGSSTGLEPQTYW
jgi:hypothetical protein